MLLWTKHRSKFRDSYVGSIHMHISFYCSGYPAKCMLSFTWANIHQLLLWVDISPNSVLSINKPTWACSCCESKPSYMLHFRCCWCWCGVIPHPNSVAILGRYPSKFSLLFLWVDTHPNLVWCWVARYLSKTSFLLWTDTHPIPICCSCGSVSI